MGSRLRDCVEDAGRDDEIERYVEIEKRRFRDRGRFRDRFRG